MHSETDASFFYVSCKVAGCVFDMGLYFLKAPDVFLKRLGVSIKTSGRLKKNVRVPLNIRR